MIKIAVCDDRKENLDELCRYIEEYFGRSPGMEREIWKFLDGKELLKEIKHQSFDVYFLDVLMPEINGLEIGRNIREKDSKAVIVYITVSREFAFEAFGIRAFHYLEKPVKKEEVFDTLDGIMTWRDRRRERRICVHTRDGWVNIDVSDIMYVENIARCAVYVLANGQQVAGVCNRGSFEESVSFLHGHPDFVQPHKSYFVNMHFIRTLGTKSLMLDNGIQIAISRKRLGETKKAYLEFLADGGDCR